MNKDWLNKCWGYAKATGIPEARAVQLSVLIWVNRDIGEVEDFDSGKYADFAAILDGSRPFTGRWLKSEDKKKTKGAIRPDNDPTEYPWEQFWDDYGKKKATKESKLAYSKLGEEDRAEIKRTLQFYITDTPDLQYRLLGSTYINSRRWEDYVGRNGVGSEVDQKNLDGLFAKLNISLPYQLVPDKKALHLALDEFKVSVEEFDERKFINSVQDYYDEKGHYGGKLANALKSQDLRNYYISRFKK